MVVVVVLFHRPRPVGVFFLGALTRSETKKTKTKMKEEDEEKDPPLTPSKTRRRNHRSKKKTVVVVVFKGIRRKSACYSKLFFVAFAFTREEESRSKTLSTLTDAFQKREEEEALGFKIFLFSRRGIIKKVLPN